MPGTSKLNYYADIPRDFTMAWKLIHKAEEQARQACLAPKTAQDRHENVLKLCKKAHKFMSGDCVRLYVDKKLSRDIIERAQKLHSKPKKPRAPSAAPPPPPPLEEPKIFIKIPARPPKIVIKIKLNPQSADTLQSPPRSSDPSSSDVGPERSRQGYRTQRSAPYAKTKRTRAPRDREPYQEADASVDALTAALQCTSIAPSSAAAAPKPRPPMRTVPSWFTMDHLAAKLEATVFFRTRPTVEAPAPVVAADAPATPSLHVAADKTRSIWSAPALPTLPSPSSSTSDLDDPPAPDPLPAGLLVERHGVARRAALPREESATARRREARFNPLDTAARGAAHTQRRTIERS